MNKLIALTGPAGSGKSTLAGLLVKNHKFTCIPFAAPIKAMIDSLLAYQGVPYEIRREMLYGTRKEVPTAFLGGKSPRHAMQTLGTEWRELLNTNLWINAWGELAKQFSNVVVDDMRFPHEAEKVRQLGGQIIFIARQGIVVGAHLSEMNFSQIKTDLDIINNNLPESMIEQMKEKFL